MVQLRQASHPVIRMSRGLHIPQSYIAAGKKFDPTWVPEEELKKARRDLELEVRNYLEQRDIVSRPTTVRICFGTFSLTWIYRLA
jgi:hypothetical protein